MLIHESALSALHGVPDRSFELLCLSQLPVEALQRSCNYKWRVTLEYCLNMPKVIHCHRFISDTHIHTQNSISNPTPFLLSEWSLSGLVIPNLRQARLRPKKVEMPERWMADTESEMEFPVVETQASDILFHTPGTATIITPTRMSAACQEEEHAVSRSRLLHLENIFLTLIVYRSRGSFSLLLTLPYNFWRAHINMALALFYDVRPHTLSCSFLYIIVQHTNGLQKLRGWGEATKE